MGVDAGVLGVGVGSGGGMVAIGVYPLCFGTSCKRSCQLEKWLHPSPHGVSVWFTFGLFGPIAIT